MVQPFILQSQLYSSVKDRTQVDRDLEVLFLDLCYCFLIGYQYITMFYWNNTFFSVFALISRNTMLTCSFLSLTTIRDSILWPKENLNSKKCFLVITMSLKNEWLLILQSFKKDKLLRIFKLSSGQDDHAIMFMDDYLKQVPLCHDSAIISSLDDSNWTMVNIIKIWTTVSWNFCVKKGTHTLS